MSFKINSYQALTAFVLFCQIATNLCGAFSTQEGRTNGIFSFRVDAVGEKQLQSEETSPPIKIEKYTHTDDWNNVTYRYKPAAPGYENHPPIVMIHPVGIGCSSWFWTRLMNEWKAGPEMYAVDLLGCGIELGADEWNPNEKGLFFPLSWAEGCESLINKVVLPRYRNRKSSFSFGMDGRASKGCIIVTQGGLAPVGVVLASRNPLSVVSKLVLASPPTWDDMITPIPSSELEKNFKFLSSPFWGNLAFSLLETRAAVAFFSDLFLFSGKSDEEWLNYSEAAMSKSARPPVQAFNSGMCNHRSFEEELTELLQPTLIVSGHDDKRSVMREQYGIRMNDCRLETISGQNVLPWESAAEFQQLLEEFS